MPQLAPEGKSEKFFLPSTESLADADKAWVIIKTGKLLGGDMLSVASINNQDQALKALIAQRIEEWNFAEADGNLSPITPDNVARMEPDDVKFLLTKLGFAKEDILTTDQKKSSSQPSEPA